MSRFEEFLLATALYKGVVVTVEDTDELAKLISGTSLYNVDCYCPTCGDKRIFQKSDVQVYDDDGTGYVSDPRGYPLRLPSREERYNAMMNKHYCLNFQCTRDHAHFLIFDVLLINNQIMKIGQYPSYADLLADNVKNYKTILGKQVGEYHRAIALFSSDIGIGAFVYLRRIIEKLVDDKYEEHKTDLPFTESEFLNSKFEKKIDMLKDYLPETLVGNKNVYGIVSKGVHQLSEEECREMFPYINAGIELILDDIIIANKRVEKEAMFTQFVGDTTGKLRKR